MTKTFMYAMLICYVASLFIIGFPYPAISILLLGTLFFILQVLQTRSMDRHCLAFMALIIYLIVWGGATGALQIRSVLSAQFIGGEGRIFLAYLPIFFVFVLPASLFEARYLQRLYVFMLAPMCIALVLGVVMGRGGMDKMFGTHHAAGYASGALVILFTSLYRYEHQRWQMIGAVVSVLLLFFANSRTTIVALLLAYMCFFHTRIFRFRIVAGVGTLVVVSLFMWRILNPFSFARMAILVDPDLWRTIGDQLSLAGSIDLDTIDNLEKEGGYHNIITRVVLWIRASIYFFESPLIGIGAFRFNDTNGFRLVELLPFVSVADSDSTSMSVFSAHNSYFQVLAEGGLIGFVLYLRPWLMMLRTFSRSRLKSISASAHRQSGILIIFFLLFGALTGHLLAAPSACFWVVTFAAISLRVIGREQSINAEERA